MATGLTTVPDGRDRLTGTGSPADALPARSWVRPAVQAVAAIAVLVALTGFWPGTAGTSPAPALVLLGCLVLVLSAAIVAVVTDNATCRSIVDWSLLSAAAAVVAVGERHAFARDRRYPSDEGRLVQHAIDAIANGHDPYGRHYPDVAHFAGNTPFFDGGAATRFGYPPLAPEIGAGLGRLWSPLGTAAAVGFLALIGAAVVCLLVLPVEWRAASIVVVLGFAPLSVYATNGHPVVLSVALLCAACACWSGIGLDGQLGPSGVARAVCLGLAASAQQLAWFIAIGLLVALWAVRRRELGGRVALAVVVRFGVAAAVAFVVVNLPFIVAAPRAWATGLGSLIGLDHPVASGQGLVMLSVMLRGQGGAFQFYGYASVLMLVGVLVVIGREPRLLAPAVPILLTLVFLVSVRSPGEYFVVFTPVWLVWLAGSDRAAAVVGGRGVSGAVARRRLPRRLLFAGLALAPAAACVIVAVARPGPLGMHVDRAEVRDGRLVAVRVTVVNHSAETCEPHFYVDPGWHIRSPWAIETGPRAVRSGQRADYLLRPALLGPERPTDALRVWALSDDPSTMSSAPLVVADRHRGS